MLKDKPPLCISARIQGGGVGKKNQCGDTHTREAGNDTGSKLNALIRRFCKCVARKELDSSRRSASDCPDGFGGINLESRELRLCCGEISSLTELNRTAGDPAAAFCASTHAESSFKVSIKWILSAYFQSRNW
jgi:hypothetical protein